MKTIMIKVLVAIMTLSTAVSLTSCSDDPISVYNEKDDSVMFDILNSQWNLVSIKGDNGVWNAPEVDGRIDFYVRFQSDYYNATYIRRSYFNNNTRELVPAYEYPINGRYSVRRNCICAYDGNNKENFCLDVLRFEGDRMEAQLCIPARGESFRIILEKSKY